jgi:hypothetical protein
LDGAPAQRPASTGRGQREIVTELLDTLLVYGAAIPYGVLRPDDSAMREIEDALYKVLLDKTSRFPVARARPAHPIPAADLQPAGISVAWQR